MKNAAFVLFLPTRRPSFSVVSFDKSISERAIRRITCSATTDTCRELCRSSKSAGDMNVDVRGREQSVKRVVQFKRYISLERARREHEREIETATEQRKRTKRIPSRYEEQDRSEITFFPDAIEERRSRAIDRFAAEWIAHGTRHKEEEERFDLTRARAFLFLL